MALKPENQPARLIPLQKHAEFCIRMGRTALSGKKAVRVLMTVPSARMWPALTRALLARLPTGMGRIGLALLPRLALPGPGLMAAPRL